MNDADSALVALLARLRALDYDFVTITPASHARIVARADKRRARDLRDIFGWNLPFDPGLLPPGLLDLLRRAEAVEPHDHGFRSRLRVARAGGHLFLHSAFPTEKADSVFFGPDTYRFLRFLEAELKGIGRVEHLVDMGAGSGAGAICAAGRLDGARLTLVDSNPAALRLARINARAAGIEAETVLADSLDGVEGAFDLLIANPPYMIDPLGRAYRDGGTLNGAQLSLDWTVAAARRIAPGGTILLYTGSAIVAGRDALRAALADALAATDCSLRYEELDPDLFGEELDGPAYRDVERIAAVGAVVTAGSIRPPQSARR